MVVFIFTVSMQVALIYYKVYRYRVGEVTLKGFQCERCGHVWVPREDETPKVCPKCKSPYWDRPRKIQGKKTEMSFKEKRRLT